MWHSIKSQVFCTRELIEIVRMKCTFDPLKLDNPFIDRFNGRDELSKVDYCLLDTIGV